MSEATYTAGPWRSRQEYANRWRVEQDTPSGTVPFSVALVTTTVLEVGSDNGTAPANARLIAASPCLLAAAEKALAECCDLISTEAGDALQAAVAKALGGAA